MARIFIGAGREAGIRPQDLVGVIDNEAGVAGQLIGAIRFDSHQEPITNPVAEALNGQRRGDVDRLGV